MEASGRIRWPGPSPLSPARAGRRSRRNKATGRDESPAGRRRRGLTSRPASGRWSGTSFRPANLTAARGALRTDGAMVRAEIVPTATRTIGSRSTGPPVQDRNSPAASTMFRTARSDPRTTRTPPPAARLQPRLTTAGGVSLEGLGTTWIDFPRGAPDGRIVALSEVFEAGNRLQRSDENIRGPAAPRW